MKSIIFDLYGTLIDIHTDESSKSFWNKFARRTRKHKYYEANKLRQKYFFLCSQLEMKNDEINILNVFMELFGVSQSEAIKIARAFRRLSIKHISLYKGVNWLLDQLRLKGYKIYLLSNAQAVFTMVELNKFRLIKKFDGIALSSDFGLKKPNLQFFNEAIKKFNIQDEVWMIGNDFDCDINPAMKLGIKTVFVETNLTPEKLGEDRIGGFKAKEILKKIIV